jgi:hypothetical protein
VLAQLLCRRNYCAGAIIVEAEEHTPGVEGSTCACARIVRRQNGAKQLLDEVCGCGGMRLWL